MKINQYYFLLKKYNNITFIKIINSITHVLLQVNDLTSMIVCQVIIHKKKKIVNYCVIDEREEPVICSLKAFDIFRKHTDIKNKNVDTAQGLHSRFITVLRPDQLKPPKAICLPSQTIIHFPF